MCNLKPLHLSTRRIYSSLTLTRSSPHPPTLYIFYLVCCSEDCFASVISLIASTLGVTASPQSQPYMLYVSFIYLYYRIHYTTLGLRFLFIYLCFSWAISYKCSRSFTHHYRYITFEIVFLFSFGYPSNSTYPVLKYRDNTVNGLTR